MLGLGKGSDNGQFVSINDAKIVIKTKENDKWIIKPDDRYDHLSGYVREVRSVEKEFQNEKYKELQLVIDVPVNKTDSNFQRYTLNCRMYKSFSDGLLLSLANADLSKTIKISPYKEKKTKKDGLKPATFCAVRYVGDGAMIPWVSGVPKTEMIDLPGGKQYANRVDKDLFIDKIIADLQAKLGELNKGKTYNLIQNSKSTPLSELAEAGVDTVEDEVEEEI